MVKPFRITSFPSIIFGVGSRKELPAAIRKFGLHTLIITGSGSFARSDQGRKLLQDIEQTGEFCHFASVPGEPTPEMIDSIVDKYRHVPLDVIVAIGGGSVLDGGKAVSAMVRKNEPVITFLEGVGTKQPDGTKVPFIAVPTTAGTGSETTKNSVISRIGENGFKKSLRHDNYIPDVALVDPELTVSCSREITSASGLDALTQLLEAYVSPKSSSFTDLFALEGLQNAIRYLKKAWEDGSNIEARSGMSYAAMLSGIVLANAGLGTVHGFASSVGGLFPVPHGVVCGTLMAEVTAMNIRKLAITKGEAYDKYVRVGKLIANHCETKPDEYYCGLLTDTLRQLTSDMELPRLSAFGVRKEDLYRIAEETENKNNPVPLSVEEMQAVLLERL